MSTFTMLDTPTIRLRARQTRPTKANDNHGFDLPHDDYDPILRMGLGALAALFGCLIGAGMAGGWAVAAALVQGGWL